MRTIFASLLFIVLALPGALAQNVYFCSNYTDNGEPMGASESWTVSPNGGYVYLLYNNGQKKLKSKFLVVSIARQDNNNNYAEIDNKVVDLQPQKNWAILDYNFTQEGSYRVTYQDNNKKELAKGFLTISFKKDPKQEVTQNENREEVHFNNNNTRYTRVEDDYYNATMTFCTGIADGRPVDPSETFTITRDGGYIWVYIMNDRPLKTDSILVNIYKKDGAYFTKLTNSERYGVNGDINGTYFKESFFEDGEYEVTVYNRYSQMIANRYVTIEWSKK